MLSIMVAPTRPLWLFKFIKWSESCSVMSESLRPHVLYSPRNSPGQNTGVGSLSLLQGIFPTQGSKPGLPHCRQILYQLSHQGSPSSLKSNPNPAPQSTHISSALWWGSHVPRATVLNGSQWGEDQVRGFRWRPLGLVEDPRLSISGSFPKAWTHSPVKSPLVSLENTSLGCWHA